MSEVITVFIIFYFLYQTIKLLVHRKERLMMVEKMEQNPGLVSQRLDNKVEISKGPYSWLKPAGLVIGMGIGCILAFMFFKDDIYIVYERIPTYTERMLNPIIPGLLLVSGGLGMLGGFFTERRLRKSDEKESSRLV